MLLPFPQELPIEAVGLIIDKLRGKDVPLASAVNAAWNLAGYAAAQALPARLQVAGGEAMNQEEEIKLLSDLLIKSGTNEHGQAVELGLIPWLLILKIALKFLANAAL